jgi:LacI family transcriptional regulator
LLNRLRLTATRVDYDPDETFHETVTVTYHLVNAQGVGSAVVVTGRVSIVDVARRAGVSVGTVSNVLNRPDRVASATRLRVQAAIKELGFVRHEAARQLRAGGSRTVGLLVLDVRNPFFTDVSTGVEAAVAAAGLTVVLCDSAGDPTRENHYLAMLQEQRAYGVLMTPVRGTTAKMRDLRRQGTAIVLVDRAARGQQCSVSVDDIAGGELAVAHLLDEGHRRIAFIGGPADIRQVQDRLAGARQAVRAHGLRDSALTVVPTADLSVASGVDAGRRIAAVDARRRPTAAFCANDLLALGVLQDATGRGSLVPDDLAIVGYDDIIYAAAAAVPLTSVRQPRAELGQAAGELLIEEVTNPAAHQHQQILFQPELVARASTSRQQASAGTS